MWGRLLVRDKKKEDEEKKATRQPEDYGLAVLGKRAINDRFKELDQVIWNDDDWKKADKEGRPLRQTGAIAWVSSLMKVAYGLARTGIASEDSVKSLAWFVARWQGALEAGDEVKSLTEALQFEMRSFFALYATVSILPEDLQKEVAVILYQGKPGQNIESQKLID